MKMVLKNMDALQSAIKKPQVLPPNRKPMKGFLNLKKLDADFEIPEDNWTREKLMGTGAYGKVMECIY
jgi:hypothetical protein